MKTLKIGVLHESEQRLQKKLANGVRVRHVFRRLVTLGWRALITNAGVADGFGVSKINIL